MEKFTKGKAIVSASVGAVYIDDVQLLASVYPCEPARKEECTANARRIAACWNACEGIPTEVLEQGPILPASGSLTAELQKIAAQRDTLLAALEAAVDCGMVPISSASDGGAVRHSRQAAVADQIRAAIATIKAGGTKVDN